ncbi:MAG: glycosyltransferase [Candidatus Peribacter sp.]|jgi:glycosyltransferase involved in cell wall biosynthesis|nr:glycosyltransferase [Candidatus Peribacter sp.]MBT4392701.1 glycosyltransferase [Candidatus Peribacter sp.]MBT4600682.1 glycosyltransferase [Candidatus Peribacter sp.]MBT5148649.1 glycosyltransferase [Candidatus Peribacter sp.]MBT5637756.1 glycosyltransferase [Candidatus Peribacter sp.]
MKIALVHELLTMRGGAERVLLILADMYPDAPIYTLLYNEKKLGEWFPQDRVRTPKAPLPYSLLPSNLKYNHHLYLKHFPKMVESLDFSEYDLVISTSSAFAHGIITNGHPKHLSYIHAPARYLWDRTHDVTEKASMGLFGSLKKRHLQKTFHPLRTWDAMASGRADKLFAASKDVQRRVELYWRKESDVIYPPIDNFWMQKSFGGAQREVSKYFLIVSTLVSYKNIDIAIKACNTLKLPLKIVGEGPHKKTLQAIAGPTIEFYGYRERDELGDLYADATAVIFPGKEDFGLVPLEAMACGTPVVAFRGGGALETIVEGKTGVFFNEKTPESLSAVLQNFDHNLYSSDACKARAKEFSQTRFENQIREAVATL